MNRHDNETPEVHQKKETYVADGQHRMVAVHRVLDTYDATTIVGLQTVVCGAAIEHTDEMGEVSIELPMLHELQASAAVSRCLMPIKLRGSEIKAIRHIMKLTLTDLAKKLDERTAAETVSRWESEAQPMGGYAEKVLRLVICEGLHKDAPGVDYNASMIADLRVLDPWRSEPNYEVPYIQLELIRIKDQASGTIIEAWDAKEAA